MEWPNVSHYLKQKVLKYNNAILLKDYGTDTSYSYIEFDVLTDRLASGLMKMGIQPGDRIAFLHTNHTDLLLGYFATIKAGAIAVPVNPSYTPRELKHILTDSGAKLIISMQKFSEKLEKTKEYGLLVTKTIVKENNQNLENALSAVVGPMVLENLVQRSADDPAMIFYTSGTTGIPKGVVISHRNITFGAGNMAQNYCLTPTDITVVCLPLNHIFANASAFWGTMASGGCAVVMERFQTDPVFDAIERERVTWFPGVPTMFSFLLSGYQDRARDISSLRMGLSGAASLPVEDLRAFETQFDALMLEVYGLTESTGLVTANPIYGVRKPGSIGICVSGVEVKLVDNNWQDVRHGEVGDLVFRGPNGTIGYWGMPAETDKKIRNGWISSGDLAYQDDEGYFYIVSRKSELIISGGYNIYPREIEDVLNSHPDVSESAVIGASDKVLGEVPKAFLVPLPGKVLDLTSLENFCHHNLAKYKIPKLFKIMKELPRNTTGKILKKDLK